MNLNIDISTLILAIILGHLFSAILGFSYMVQHKQDSEIYPFLFARLFDTMGWFFIGLQVLFFDIKLILVGNTFLIVAQTVQIASFLKIKNHYGRLVKKGYFIAAIVSAFLLYFFTLQYHANGGMRVTIMSAAVALMWCYPEYVMLKDKESSVLQRVIAFIYGGELVLLFLRAYIGVKFNQSMSLMSYNLSNVLFFIVLYLVMLMGNMGFILMAKEKTDLELIKAARYDELTEIFNRREFLKRGREMVSLYERKREPLSFLMIDLDHFKRINDIYGHGMGDMVLKEFADILRRNLQENDLSGRFGGEEFTVLLPGAEEKAAWRIAEQVRVLAGEAAVSTDMGEAIKYTISIGIAAAVPDGTTSLETLYKSADDALYRAKMNGRNRVEASEK